MRCAAVCLVAFIAASTLILTGPGKSAPPAGAPASQAAVNPKPTPGPTAEPKWFKVLVTFSKTRKEPVRYALPLSLIDVVAKCVDRETFKFDAQGGYFNLKALFAELKAMGPLIFVEITGTGETIKLWLE
jgi:hypothetical protein